MARSLVFTQRAEPARGLLCVQLGSLGCHGVSFACAGSRQPPLPAELRRVGAVFSEGTAMSAQESRRELGASLQGHCPL